MVRNPRANAIIERTHQAMANMAKTFELEDTHMDKNDPWGGILAATAFAARLTCHTALQATPGQLLFGGDMMFDIEHMANWQAIKERNRI